MKKLKSKKLTFSSSERRKIKEIIRTSLRTDTSVQTVFKGPIRFINQNEFNLTVDNPKARQKIIRALKKAVKPMRLVLRFRGPVVIGVKRMSKPKKVLNPITGKYIAVGGPTYKRMIKEGFTVSEGILKPPKDYMRKNRKNASLIIINNEIERIKKKEIPNKDTLIKTLEEAKTKISFEKQAPIPKGSQIPTNIKEAPIPKRSQIPTNIKAPNRLNIPKRSQIPTNTKAPNLKRNQMGPASTKAPNLKRNLTINQQVEQQPTAGMIAFTGPPQNTRPAWKKAINFVNPFYKKPINNNAKRINNATVNLITKMKKEEK